jgi:hypothetical protein
MGRRRHLPIEQRVADLLLGTWRYFGIEVYRLPAQVLLDRGLLPLVPFTPEGGDPAVVERAAAEIKQRGAPDDVQELESLLAVFAARTMGEDLARSIVRRLFVST